MNWVCYPHLNRFNKLYAGSLSIMFLFMRHVISFGNTTMPERDLAPWFSTSTFEKFHLVIFFLLSEFNFSELCISAVICGGLLMCRNGQ